MKKSNLIALIAILGCAATLTAANLKLKQEYGKGYLKSAYTAKELPVFHFIKSDIDSTSRTEGSFEISAGAKNGSSMSAYYSNDAQFVLTVVNDTLYIKTSPVDKESRHYISIKIKTENLKGIFANRYRYKITVDQADSLEVKAAGKAEVNLALKRVNTLTLNGSENAEISLSADNMINYLSLDLNDKSSFIAKDFTAKNKKIRFSKTASLQFSGQSLESLELFKD